ncbi:DoxX family protein [Streptomyces mirabilis]|uniref:DoxX family protein n=1 Tax=Streptomyces mirabilis TaxID=68239 RepID=UPI0036AE11B4
MTGIAVWLAVAAAVGLVLVQIGGLALHLSRGEFRDIWLNIVLLALAAVTVWPAIAWL